MPRLSPLSCGFALFLGVLTLALQGHANPLRRQTASITALSDSQISAFEPFSFYASTAYCQPSTILNWSCGRSISLFSPSFSSSLIKFPSQRTATQTLIFSQLNLVVMVLMFNSGTLGSTQVSRYVNIFLHYSLSCLNSIRLLSSGIKEPTPPKCKIHISSSLCRRLVNHLDPCI